MEQLILPDGQVIASGVWGEPAMTSVRWTQDRNEGDQLALGAVCCAELEIELFSLKKPDIPPETRLIYQEDGVKRGVFYCQSLTRKSQNRWVLRALDGMHRFYRELTGFWKDRPDDTVLSLLLGLCQHCGVATAITQLPGGDTPVPRLAGYSARQLLRFLGQVAGRYFYIDKDENLCAGWYEEIQSIDNFHHLKTAEFTTQPIERVWLRRTEQDIGWAYPAGEEEKNTLIIQGNPIFSPGSEEAQKSFRQFSTISEEESFRQFSTIPEEETFRQFSTMEVAERLFRQFSTFSHTPFTCRLLPGQEVSPGCLVEFTDLDGVKRTGAVMGWEKKNGTLTVRGTGSYSLQSAQAFEEFTQARLEGQVLEISRTAQGLSVSHTDLLGNVGALELSLSGVQTQVTALTQTADALTTQTSQLHQDAQGLSLQVSQLTGSLDGKTDREEFSQVTEHFIFDAAGLTIQNSATGMGIRVSEEQVLFLGGADPTTVIHPDAMQTARLSVGQRLDIGDFSLLPRTAGNLSLRYTGIK